MNKIKKIVNNKYFIIGLITLFIVIIGIAGTYAWLTWSSPNTTKMTMTIGNIADVIFDNGQDINTTDLSPVFYPEEGEKNNFSIVKRSTATSTNITYTVTLDIITIANELKSTSFKYKLINTTSNSEVVSGDFSSASNGNTLTLYTGTLTDIRADYTFLIYIDSNIENNTNMMNKQFIATLNVSASEKSNIKLGQYITDLYTNASKSTVTNNNITYNTAPSVGLMNDRLGGTTTGYDDGNIRYYGASPNNYIDIGDAYESDTIKGKWENFGTPFTQSSECYAFFECSNLVNKVGVFEDEASCTAGLPTLLEEKFGVSSVGDICDTTTIPKGTPILYRVIGLFKDIQLADGTKQDLIKVVRAESIGKYSWDTSDSSVNSGYGINEWSQADLMKLLNPGYESEIVGGSLWWNSGSGTCYNNQSNETTSCDFTNIGLSDNVKDKIASVVWNTGGWDSPSVYSDQMYGYERGEAVYTGRPTTWTGKIALPYPSDYGYATDLGTCTQTLFNNDNSTCTSVNWMKSIFTSDSWLLTPDSGYSDNAWYVYSSSGFLLSRNVDITYHANGVAPVLYLSSELEIESGTGTSSDPYRLSV